MADFELKDLGEGHFSLSGEMTFENAEQILSSSKSPFSKHARLELDCSGVSEADSAGLALLLEWKSWFLKRRGEIHYSGLPDSIVAIARTTDVENLIR